MSSSLTIERFNDSMASEWDAFLNKKAINGTFLQSRRFLSYHPKDRFEDYSLVVRKGQEIVCVIPACRVNDGHDVVFYSHLGSTFGGYILSPSLLNINPVLSLVSQVDEWLQEHGFSSVVLKQTSDIFCNMRTESLDYALQHEGYSNLMELSFFIDLESYKEPVELNFTGSRRRDCRYGEKAGCHFVELSTDEEIGEFYSVLKKSLQKYNATPVHSLEELLDFKNNRLSDVVEFYGVKLNDSLIAGSMVFILNQVFHTQYLAADPASLDVFPMNYLDWNLIRVAKERNFKSFSFGISTENHGRVLNSTLASFKEGFGGSHSINRTFFKHF